MFVRNYVPDLRRLAERLEAAAGKHFPKTQSPLYLSRALAPFPYVLGY
jgi:hypothetical protein